MLSRAEKRVGAVASGALLLFVVGQLGWSLNPERVPLQVRVAVDLAWLLPVAWLSWLLLARGKVARTAALLLVLAPFACAGLLFATVAPHGLVLQDHPRNPQLLVAVRWWLAGKGQLRVVTPRAGGWLLEGIGETVLVADDSWCPGLPNRFVLYPETHFAVLAAGDFCRDGGASRPRPGNMYLELIRLGPGPVERVPTGAAYGTWERDEAIRALLADAEAGQPRTKER